MKAGFALFALAADVKADDPWGESKPWHRRAASTGPSDEPSTGPSEDVKDCCGDQARCSTVSSWGNAECGANKVYNSANAASYCDSTACSSSTEADKTTCCGDQAQCSTVSSWGNAECGANKVYNLAASASTCAATTCSSSTQADKTACCHAQEAPTSGLPSVLTSAPTTDTVMISTTISGVDYSLLSAELLASLKEALVETFAQAAGVPKDQTSVEVSEGSVLVVATITATDGETFSETEVKAPEAASIVAAVRSVPNIADATEDGAEITATKPQAVLFKAGETKATHVTPVTVAIRKTSFATRAMPVLAIVIGLASLAFS